MLAMLGGEQEGGRRGGDLPWEVGSPRARARHVECVIALSLALFPPGPH